MTSGNKMNIEWLKIFIWGCVILLVTNFSLSFLLIPWINYRQHVRVVKPSTWLQEVDNEGSFLLEIEKLQEGYVHFSCYITLENLSDKEQEVYLVAFMPYEMLAGAIRHPLVYAKMEDHETNKVYHLEAGEKKTFSDVHFCDSGFGKLVKMNRLLPWIVAKDAV